MMMKLKNDWRVVSIFLFDNEVVPLVLLKNKEKRKIGVMNNYENISN